jgi:hypothetical protein
MKLWENERECTFQTLGKKRIIILYNTFIYFFESIKSLAYSIKPSFKVLNYWKKVLCSINSKKINYIKKHLGYLSIFRRFKGFFISNAKEGLKLSNRIRFWTLKLFTRAWSTFCPNPEKSTWNPEPGDLDQNPESPGETLRSGNPESNPNSLNSFIQRSIDEHSSLFSKVLTWLWSQFSIKNG